jgi:hypothetical protein
LSSASIYCELILSSPAYLAGEPNPEAGRRTYYMDGKILIGSTLPNAKRDWPTSGDFQVEFILGPTIETDTAIGKFNGIVLRAFHNTGGYPVRNEQLKGQKAMFESSATCVRVPGTPTEHARFEDLQVRPQAGAYQAGGFQTSDLQILINREGDSGPLQNASPSFMHYCAAVQGGVVEVWDRYEWTKQPGEW